MSSNENLQPEGFELETSTVWSFKRRGKWATHKSSYRGNWAPQVARNIILRYSEKEDYVLDPMVGGGTTLVESKLTGRHCLGVDINPEAVKTSKEALGFEIDHDVKVKVKEGDARNLEYLDNESIDLVATHPPYANIIEYSDGEIDQDLSSIDDIDEFYEEMEKIAEELLRVVKPGKYCAILIGDTRQNKHHVPISANVLQRFLKVGFVLKENIIKHQWNTKTESFWSKRSKEYNFLLIKHEQLFVFRKPEKGENLKNVKNSRERDV